MSEDMSHYPSAGIFLRISLSKMNNHYLHLANQSGIYIEAENLKCFY